MGVGESRDGARGGRRGALTRAASRKRRLRRRLLALLVLGAAAAGGMRLWLEVRARQKQERIASLERTRDGLRERLAALSANDPVVTSAPDADVLIGVPEGVATDLLGRVTTSLVRQVVVELRDLDVHKAGLVRLKTLLGRTTPGAYDLNVRIREVTGVLEPGPPKVDLRGGRLAVALPVRVARGQARATLRFRWDSRGISGAACGDFRARIPMTGRVVPRTYPVSGSFALALVDGTLEALPSFPDLAVNLQVEPSPETWKALDRVLGQRSLQCRAALKLFDVKALVQRMLDRGFTVPIPPTIFKPLRLPASLRKDVRLGARTHHLQMTPRELSLAPGLVWLSADLRDERSPSPVPPPEAVPPAGDAGATAPSPPG